MVEYKGNKYEVLPEQSEFSCDGCAFHYECKRIRNVGKASKPEYKEVSTGQKGCGTPNIEPFRSCKHNHVIFKQAPQSLTT